MTTSGTASESDSVDGLAAGLERELAEGCDERDVISSSSSASSGTEFEAKEGEELSEEDEEEDDDDDDEADELYLPGKTQSKSRRPKVVLEDDSSDAGHTRKSKHALKARSQGSLHRFVDVLTLTI